ncbi:hypothetical protein H9X98_22960 [Aeromonas jandaei]|uniref:AfaD family invasin n=1 Tax=Aeromonas jandaei TaxID=650 RepID=UPI001F2A4FAF|nr:AfaD family invasin [Aeromonas jandaei]MCF7718070.1 hypothetical protein [Aeromonas jandaei]MCF7720507.1 hypothetical protein [Aeromonas jandaei]
MTQLTGGELIDGQLIGKGKVTCERNHSLFRVFGEVDGQLNYYLLKRKDNQDVSIKVRLDGDNWQHSSILGEGMIKNSSEFNEFFDIRAYGKQKIQPGIYTFRLYGACFLQ